MTHYFLRKMSSDPLKCGPTPSYDLFMTWVFSISNPFSHCCTFRRQKYAKDDRREATKYDEYAVGIYKNDSLVGHVPIELSSLINFFLKTDCGNNGHATLSGKIKREVGLVVPASFSARTKNKKNAKERVASSKSFIRLDIKPIISLYTLKIPSLATTVVEKNFKLRKKTRTLYAIFKNIINHYKLVLFLNLP